MDEWTVLWSVDEKHHQSHTKKKQVSFIVLSLLLAVLCKVAFSWLTKTFFLFVHDFFLNNESWRWLHLIKRIKCHFECNMRCIWLFPSHFYHRIIIKMQSKEKVCFEAEHGERKKLNFHYSISIVADENSYQKFKNVTYINRNHEELNYYGRQNQWQQKKWIFHKFVFSRCATAKHQRRRRRRRMKKQRWFLLLR